jgi:predicted alpha/beta-hydrolase family hydrolase
MVTVYRSDRATAGLVLAHGAGGGQHSRFMVDAGRAFAARGITTATFDFPYIVAGRKVPDKAPVLETAWRDALAEVRQHEAFARLPLFIGGKSMGGRMATLVADELQVRGAVVFGYPFHPPGQPDKLRTAHLEKLATPMLVLQGERDPFGTRDDVAGYQLSSQLRIEWIPDGDHSLKPRAKSGRTERQNLLHAIDAAAEFMSSR